MSFFPIADVRLTIKLELFYIICRAQIKVFWDPRLDTIVGPIPTPPSHRPLTHQRTWLEFGVSPSKKFEIANAIGEFQRRNQVKISEGKIEDKARTYGAKRPRIEGKARTEGEARDREGKRSGEGVRWASPQKICENLNLKPCRQSGAQSKQQSRYIFSRFYYFFL